jgi:putative ABC transport system ATP-binding protein
MSPDTAARQLTERLGLIAWIDSPVTELSVGQQQRVAAARALIGSPEFIIADEPTSALDTEHREEFIKQLFAAADDSGATVVFVSHDRSLAGLFGRQIALPEVNSAARPRGREA